MIRISVIISTNRPFTYVRRTLKSLLSLDFPPLDFEIIIVDNGPVNQGRDVLEGLDFGEISIKYIKEPIPGLLSGRHRGAIEARGEVLVFTDDDVLVEAGWLKAIAHRFQDPSIHIIGGRNLPQYESKPPKWISEFYVKNDKLLLYCSQLSSIDLGESFCEIEPTYVWGLNYSIRKSTFFQIGGFNPDLYPISLRKYQGNGETGLSLKAMKANIKAYYEPKALIHHIIPAERMTVDFFKYHAHYSGICDSYKKIRELRVCEEIKKGSLLNAISSMVYSFSAHVREKIPYALTKDHFLRQTLSDAYREGFAFHHAEVSRDPSLLDWVLKADYWDYNIYKYQPSSFAESYDRRNKI